MVICLQQGANDLHMVQLMPPTNARDALHHGKHAANKGGCSV